MHWLVLPFLRSVHGNAPVFGPDSVVRAVQNEYNVMVGTYPHGKGGRVGGGEALEEKKERES